MTKILLVEDDKSLREIYGVRLLAEGYDIVSAGDGEDALAMAIKERPTLIVSDVMMPKISGFDMLDILRSTTETRDIKVIMMTALSSEDQRARGEQLGADRYLVKSQVGIEDVVRTVHEVLGDQGAPQAPQAQPVASAPEQQPAPIASTPVAPAPQPTAPQSPAPSSLPQPTAPFSSPRPATLGERVINPIQPQDGANSTSISDQIAQELQAAVEPAPAPQPVSNPVQNTAAPSPAPQQQQSVDPATQQPVQAQPQQPAPQPAATPQQQQPTAQPQPADEPQTPPQQWQPPQPPNAQ